MEATNTMAVANTVEREELVITQAHSDLEWSFYGPDGEIPLFVEREDADGSQAACFERDNGYLPRCAAELDAYSSSEEEWAAYRLANPALTGDAATLVRELGVDVETGKGLAADVAPDAAVVAASAEPPAPTKTEQELGEEYDAALKLVTKYAHDMRSAHYGMAVASLEALTAKLALNEPLRKRGMRADMLTSRGGALAGIAEKAFLADYEATAEQVRIIRDAVPRGAAAKLIFGATLANPIVCDDGCCWDRVTKSRDAMPLRHLDLFVKLVCRVNESATHGPEVWDILPYVQDEVMEYKARYFAGGVEKKDMPKHIAGIIRTSLERRAEHGDKVAAEELRKIITTVEPTPTANGSAAGTAGEQAAPNASTGQSGKGTPSEPQQGDIVVAEEGQAPKGDSKVPTPTLQTRDGKEDVTSETIVVDVWNYLLSESKTHRIPMHVMLRQLMALASTADDVLDVDTRENAKDYVATAMEQVAAKVAADKVALEAFKAKKSVTAVPAAAKSEQPAVKVEIGAGS